MSLVNMKELLKEAKKNRYAIGAFNVANMEMVMAAIKVAEELNTPIIMQIAEVRLNYSPLELIGPMMVAAAKNAKVPVVCHLDHGCTKETILKALEIGFSSVMIDASHLPVEENIKLTNEITEIANKYGASVEAELGIVGGSEGDEGHNEVRYSSLEEIVHFIKSTDIAALAVAIGNAHGVYTTAPKLNFDLLKRIDEALPETPLVLHGGTGITDEDFVKLIGLGICKVNVATASFLSVYNNVKAEFAANNVNSFFDLSSAMVKGAYDNIKRHALVFNSTRNK